jgi:DNA-binding NarL/FixJ family response regulator
MVAVNRVIAVVPSPEDFQRICDSLARDNIAVEHASCLLGAVLAHAHAQIAARAGNPRDRNAPQGPVILYDIDAVAEAASDQPAPDWREAMGHFLNMHPDTRVLFVSRLADERMWIEVLATGAHDLLSKPYSQAELRQAVRRALLSSKIMATAA